MCVDKTWEVISRFWSAGNWNPLFTFHRHSVLFFLFSACINYLFKDPAVYRISYFDVIIAVVSRDCSDGRKNTLDLLHKSGDIYFYLLFFRCLHSQLSVCFLRFWFCIAVILTNIISVLYLINFIIKDDIIRLVQK